MSNINKDAVLNPFTNLVDDVFKYTPRASTTEYGVVALGSGIKIDAFGKIYTDTSALQLQINQKAETEYVDAAVGAISTNASKQYATLALANAAITNIALNENIFVSEAINGGYWYKTTAGATSLTKSPHDPLTQSKNYTDLALPIIKYGNLHDPANNATGVYVRNDGYILVANADSIVATVPVEAGKTYAVKAIPFDTAYLTIGLKVDNNATAGQTMTLATLTNTTDANVKTFSVPVGSTAKYALINIKVGTSFDARNGFVVNGGVSITSTNPVKNVVAGARGAEIADIVARNKIEVLELQPYVYETDLTLLNVGNLFYQSTPGYYITIGTGRFSVNADSAVGFFPIEAGKTYAIKPGNFNVSYFSLMLKADNVVGTGTGTNVTNSLVATADPNVKLLVVPADSTAKYALINVKVGASFDIRATLVVNSGDSITDSGAYRSVVTKVSGNNVFDEESRALIKTVDDKVTGSIISPLKGKKWVVIGDSITEVNFRTSKNYHAYVSDNVGGMTIYNYGQSGTGYYGRSNVDATVTQDADYLTVFFGTNDWSNSDPNNTKLLGVFGDTDTTTIAGCVYKCLNQLVTRFYNKRIAVFTPLPRSDNYGSNAAPNSRGFTLEQLAKVIKQTADHLSIPCLDLYHESNLPVWVYAGNQFYFTPPTGGSADGLHPNGAGHQILARKIQKFLEAI